MYLAQQLIQRWHTIFTQGTWRTHSHRAPCSTVWGRRENTWSPSLVRTVPADMSFLWVGFRLSLLLTLDSISPHFPFIGDHISIPASYSIIKPGIHDQFLKFESRSQLVGSIVERMRGSSVLWPLQWFLDGSWITIIAAWFRGGEITICLLVKPVEPFYYGLKSIISAGQTPMISR